MKKCSKITLIFLAASVCGLAIHNRCSQSKDEIEAFSTNSTVLLTPESNKTHYEKETGSPFRDPKKEFDDRHWLEFLGGNFPKVSQFEGKRDSQDDKRLYAYDSEGNVVMLSILRNRSPKSLCASHLIPERLRKSYGGRIERIRPVSHEEMDNAVTLIGKHYYTGQSNCDYAFIDYEVSVDANTTLRSSAVLVRMTLTPEESEREFGEKNVERFFVDRRIVIFKEELDNGEKSYSSSRQFILREAKYEGAFEDARKSPGILGDHFPEKLSNTGPPGFREEMLERQKRDQLEVPSRDER